MVGIAETYTSRESGNFHLLFQPFVVDQAFEASGETDVIAKDQYGLASDCASCSHRKPRMRVLPDPATP